MPEKSLSSHVSRGLPCYSVRASVSGCSPIRQVSPSPIFPKIRISSAARSRRNPGTRCGQRLQASAKGGGGGVHRQRTHAHERLAQRRSSQPGDEPGPAQRGWAHPGEDRTKALEPNSGRGRAAFREGERREQPSGPAPAPGVPARARNAQRGQFSGRPGRITDAAKAAEREGANQKTKKCHHRSEPSVLGGVDPDS